MTAHAFNSASTLQTQGAFAKPLGRMLVDLGQITEEKFQLVGEAQARTDVIARLFDEDHSLHAPILQSFGNKDGTQLDLNGIAFKYSTDTIVPELDGFLRGLNVPNLDARLQASKAAVDAQKGVHANAAAAAVLHKGLFLTRDERQPVIDASLIMQMSTRALARYQAISEGKLDREAANALVQIHNKINFKFDSPALQDANTALLTLCITEINLHNKQLKGVPMDKNYRNSKEFEIRDSVTELLETMPLAIDMYAKAGRTELADKARQVFLYNHAEFNGRSIVKAPAVGGDAAPAAPAHTPVH